MLCQQLLYGAAGGIHQAVCAALLMSDSTFRNKSCTLEVQRKGAAGYVAMHPTVK